MVINLAERRMFAKTIIDSDAFLDMPLSTQSLYFHLSMRADDEGFVNNPKKIQRMIGCSDDDFKLLIAKRFIILFASGVIVIKHWKMHNYIQKDRFKPTVYQHEAKMLRTKENGSYTLDTTCIQDGYSLDTQVRLGKDRLELGKESKTYCLADAKTVLDFLNTVVGSAYKITTKKNQDLIKARMKEGFTVDDFKTVITKKHKEWKGTEMEKYLRPETLFGTKFESYLNQKEVVAQGKEKTPSGMMKQKRNLDEFVQ